MTADWPRYKHIPIVTLDPIRRHNFMKSSLDPGVSQRTKSNLSPERVYRCNLCQSDGGQTPITAQPQAQVYPLVLLMDREVAGCFLPPIGYTITAATRRQLFCGCVSPLEKFGLPRLRARGIHGREA